MQVEIANPITTDAKISGSGLVALMCRVVVENGSVKLIIGDHVHYHAKSNGRDGITLLNTGPVPVKKTKKKIAAE